MRIVSWNIQWGRGADGKVELSRTVEAIRAMGADGDGPDVVCLQEVARDLPGLAGGRQEDGVTLLAAAFPRHEAAFGAGLDVPDGKGGRARFGNLILSRRQVGQVFRHLLPAPADPGVSWMQRVCVEAVVSAPWGWLRVLTTHLEYYSARHRLAQVRALRAVQEEVAGHACARRAEEGGAVEVNPAFAPRPRPVSAVLCGDFNCEPESAEYALMGAPLAYGVPAWRDAWRIAHGAKDHAPSVGLHGAEWPDRRYCCDFFFVSEDLAPRVAAVTVNAATPVSDHQPVILDLND